MTCRQSRSQQHGSPGTPLRCRLSSAQRRRTALPVHLKGRIFLSTAPSGTSSSAQRAIACHNHWSRQTDPSSTCSCHRRRGRCSRTTQPRSFQCRGLGRIGACTAAPEITAYTAVTVTQRYAAVTTTATRAVHRWRTRPTRRAARRCRRRPATCYPPISPKTGHVALHKPAQHGGGDVVVAHAQWNGREIQFFACLFHLEREDETDTRSSDALLGRPQCVPRS